MFTNLIIFIAVLCLYSFSPETRDWNLADSHLWHVPLLALFFHGVNRLRFGLLYREAPRMQRELGLAALDRLVTQQSALAVAFFLGYVYVLPLKAFITGLSLVQRIPTLGAVAALVFFLLHLVMVWSQAHPVYAALNRTPVTRSAYVRQNLVLAVPVLLPWALFSGILDVLLLVPLEPFTRFLESGLGQLAYFIVMLPVLVLFGPMLIVRIWGCKPLPPGPVRKRMEDICRQAGFTCREILSWPLFGGNMITAAIFGLAGPFRFILVTDAMLRVASPEEMDAVLAHEIGHSKHKHMIFFLILVTAMIPLMFAAAVPVDMAMQYLLLTYLPLDGDFQWFSWQQNAVAGLFAVAFVVVYFRFVFGYFMRNFERQADLHVYEVLPNALPLVSCFKKIAWYSGRPVDEPNWHHFGIGERIRYILLCEEDRRWIARHHAKVRRSLWIFALLAALCAAGWTTAFVRGDMGLGMKTAIHILEKRLDTEPGDPRLIAFLADACHADGDYGHAIQYYLRAIEGDPSNAEAFNGLAWLYATCEDVEFRNPEKALQYARMAASLSPAPHILDTLAESLYVNGRFQEAVEVEKQALEESGGDAPHRLLFQQNLEKYEKAAKAGQSGAS